MNRQAGQITVEAVLVLTILVSTVFTGTRFLRDKQILTKMVERPWTYLAGMIENGMWMPAASSRGKHPNQLNRHGSPTGDTP